MNTERRKISSLALDLERLSAIGDVITVQIDLQPLPDVIQEQLKTIFNDPHKLGRYRDNMIFIDRAGAAHIDYEEILTKIATITGGIDSIDGIVAMLEIPYQGVKQPIVVELDFEHKAPQVLSVHNTKELFNITNLIQAKWALSRKLISEETNDKI